MADPQQMVPAPIREYLVEVIAEQTGQTNPTDIRFEWTGLGEGVVAWADGVLTVTGEYADNVREIEEGTKR